MIDSRGSRAAEVLAGAFALCAGLAVGGCGGAQSPRCESSEAITLHVHPAKHLNPDRAGLPRSVVVRFYQVGDARAFNESSFDRVWTNAAEGLPTPEQLVALPGRDQAHALRRDPAARYLAVAANFREREGDSHWRAFMRLPAPRSDCGHWPSESVAAIELTLADYALHLR
jgi:type VI secretion system VasD/TssJ family lipoprotein